MTRQPKRALQACGMRVSVRATGLSLFAAAAAVRLGYLTLAVDSPLQDTADYDEIAMNLLSGDGFVARANWFGFEMRSWRPPLYPAFLAAVYASVGYSHLAVKIVQALIGALTVVVVYALGRQLQPRAALLAGAVAVVYMPLVGSANEVMTETLFTFLLMVSILLLATAGADTEETNSAAVRNRSLTAGIALGFAALTRPTGLLLWPAALTVWRWGAGRAATTPWLRRSSWLSLGVVAAIAPWTVRNYHVHDAFVAISTHGGFIFARSNAPLPDWKQPQGWGIDRELFERLPLESDRDRYWYSRGWQHIRADPAHYLRLVGERFLRFWYFLRPDFNFWFAMVLPLAAAGGWRYRRHPGYEIMAALVAASVLVFSFVLYGSSRFRLPLEPLFILFAATFVSDLWASKGARRAGGLVAALAAVNLVLSWHEETVREVVLALLTAWGLK